MDWKYSFSIRDYVAMTEGECKEWNVGVPLNLVPLGFLGVRSPGKCRDVIFGLQLCIVVNVKYLMRAHDDKRLG